eukprot:GHVL01010922.1.p1 GENE.GHVL01010922.1~~GHVL01010922.1.p1  ORF type:complete len:626 (+),score=50.69 GHVL01010922.1:152-2029(+)
MSGKEEEIIEALEDRRVTDLPCCVAFVLFLIGVVLCSFTALKEGNTERLHRGINYNGKICGVDIGVEDRPYLFWPISPKTNEVDLETPMCVKKCFTQEDVDNKVTVNFPERDVSENKHEQVQVTTETEMEALVYATKPVLHSYCGPLDHTLANKITHGAYGSFKQFQDAVASLSSGWPVLLLIVIVAVGVCVLYTLMIRFAVRAFVITIVVLALLIFLVLGCGLIEAGTSGLSADYMKASMTATAQTISILLGVVFLLFFALTLLVVVIAWKAIKMATGVLEVASECIMDMPSLMWGPIITAGTQVVWIFFWIIVALHIASAGDISGKSFELGFEDNGGAVVHGLHREISWDARIHSMFWFWLFALAWIFECCHAFGQFATSFAVVDWYYTESDEDGSRMGNWCPIFEGMYNGVIYHGGSIVLGALVISVCRVIQALMWWASTKAEKSGNELAEKISKSMSCCVDCFRKFIEFVNKNAYIEIVVTSKWFCSAAQSAFQRLLRAPMTVLLLNGLTTLITCIGAMTIAAGCAGLAYLCFNKINVFNDDSSSWFVADPNMPSLICGLLAGFISMGFLSVWDQTGDTILYCFLVESEKGLEGEEGGEYTVEDKTYAPPQLKCLLQDHGM